MGHLSVDPARSHLDVAARPALPGLRLHLRAGDGALTVDGDRLDGSLAATLWCRPRGEASPVTTPPWLADGHEVPLALTVHAAGIDAERCAVTVAVAVAGPDGRDRPEVPTMPDLTVRGVGRWRRAGEGIDAFGQAPCDPRALGFALPPLVTFTLTIRWRLHLLGVAGPGGRGEG